MLFFRGIRPSALQLPLEFPHQRVQYPAVCDTQHNQHGGTDRRADNVAYPREAVEAVSQCAGGSCHDYTGDDDDGRVSEAEECAYGGGALAERHQTPGHEVDGGDVVCVEGVAEAEGVGEGCGGYEGRVVVEDDGDACPYDEVDGDEEGDYEDGVGGDA